MSWRQFLLSAAVALWAVVSPAQTEIPPRTADELIKIAFERNRDFQALKQRVAEAHALLRRAGVRPAPTVELAASTGKALGTAGEQEFTAGYFQPIETFGKREKRIRVAQAGIEAAEAEIADKAHLLAFDIEMRYADDLAVRQKLLAIESLLAGNQETRRLTEARFQQGDAARLELDLLLTDLSRAEAQHAIISGRAEGTLLELKRVVGLESSDPLRLAGALAPVVFDVPLEQLKSRAIDERPDLRTAKVLEEQAKAEVSLVKAEGRPDLTLSAAYSQRTSRFDQQLGIPALRDRDNILTFGLAVPLFSAKRNQGNVEAALSRASAASLRRQHLEATIPLEVEAAYRQWAATRRATDVLGGGVLDRSENSLRVMRQAYGLGELRMIDVLNQQRLVIEARMAHIEAMAENSKAFAELKRAVGGRVP